MTIIQKDFFESLFDIRGKVALVTGATGSLGGTMATAYAQAGCKVVITGRNEEKLAKLEQDIRDLGGDVISFACDLMDEAAVQELVKTAVDKYGQIDILFVAHGYNKGQNILEQSLEDWQKVMNSDCVSVYIICKYVGEQMPHRERAARWSSPPRSAPAGAWPATPVTVQRRLPRTSWSSRWPLTSPQNTASM